MPDSDYEGTPEEQAEHVRNMSVRPMKWAYETDDDTTEQQGS
ncbi:hypothetical protein AB0B15_14320 [Streptomyces sp. NPDC045456]